jgi:Rrf2 family protein
MLTNRGKYGLKAMVHLAGAPAATPMLVADIAAAENIPKKFLDAILGELRMAGLVHSKKGRGGGFVLARSAEKIAVGEIVRALDGMLAPIACASKKYYRKCDDCPSEGKCRVRLMMREVRASISNVLDHRSLADMRRLGTEGLQRKGPPRSTALSERVSPAKRNSTTRAKATHAASRP